MGAEHVIITGRSGAGVSTTAVNLSAALADEGYRVAHVGYDERHLSTALLRGASPLEACGAAGGDACPLCSIGYREILCVETGNGDPTDAAASARADQRRHELIDRHRPDLVVHDLSGEPAAVLPRLRALDGPMRLYVVTSADVAAIATLNAFLAEASEASWLAKRLGGVIANNLAGPFFESIVADFVRESGARLVANVPRSIMVSFGEYLGTTIIDAASRSHVSYVYRKLARTVTDGDSPGGQKALGTAAFEAWLHKWSDIIAELDTGLVRDGAAI